MSSVSMHDIAKVCHEVNRVFCKSIGDMSQLPWEEAEQWQRTSAFAGVRFRLENPTSPASAQHDNWMADKIRDGWVYGELKDATAKTHPCLVPYEQLPKEQQTKDALFMAVVSAMSGYVSGLAK